MPQQKAGRRIFYGWHIVLSCFIIMGVVTGLVNNCSGQFIKPICDDLGFDRAAFAVVNTIVGGGNMLISLFAGVIYHRFDVRRTMQLAAVLMPAAYLCYPLCRTLPAFYLCAAVVGLSEGLLVAVAISLLVSNWFVARKGFAMGVASMGSGVAGMIGNVAVEGVISRLGWQSGYRFLGVIMVVCLIPICFFVIRTSPADLGLEPYGAGQPIPGKPANAEDGALLRDVWHTPKFLILCFLSGMMTFCTGGLVHQVAPHISDVGFSSAFAAKMVSAVMASLAIGKALLGWLYDKLGVRGATLFSNGTLMLGLIGTLIVPQFRLGLVLIVIGGGLGSSYGAVAAPMIVQKLYGQRDYGALLGRVSAFCNGASMLSPILINRAFDLTGTYKTAFSVMLGVVVVGTLSLSVLLNSIRKEQH